MVVEIYFDDLSEVKQKEVLEECGYGDAKEGNFEVLPLVIFEVDAKVREESIKDRMQIEEHDA